MEQDEKLQTIRKKNKRMLYFLIVIFLGPAMIAYVLYTFFPNYVQSITKSNYGSFITKLIVVKSEGLIQASTDKAVAKDYFLRKWTYVYFDSSACDLVCLKNIDNQRRIELAQGKEALRVRRIFILTDTNDAENFNNKMKKFKNVHVFKLSKTKQESFIEQFEVTDDTSVARAKRTYLVDPKGRLMMYYESDKNKEVNIKVLKGMGDDLKLLLKNSMIG